jgi:NADPH:quinone reductase-like Zn-dependent oxidoreductase
MSTARISQRELESYLWGAAIVLRGLIDAGDYKQYIFPLVFLKRISDVYDEEHAAAMEIYGDEDLADLPENHRFAIPDGCHWGDIHSVTQNIGATVLRAMRAVESANPDTLPGVFGDGDWGNKNLLPDATLADLIEHFSTQTLSIANLPEDGLGNGYEYLDRPHADLHLAGKDGAAAGLLPEGTDPERAVFLPLARVALGGVHDAAISVGEIVLVTGLGTVGLLAAQLAMQAGAGMVIGIDQYTPRVEAARGLGVHAITPEPGQDIAEIVAGLAGGDGADAAIEASGSYRLLHQAIRSVRACGRVVTVASYHGDRGGLLLGYEYHRNRITLISSMTVNGCPQCGHPAWDLDRLNMAARDLVLNGSLAAAELITHRVPFTAAYQLIDSRPDKTIKVVLTHAG